MGWFTSTGPLKFEVRDRGVWRQPLLFRGAVIAAHYRHIKRWQADPGLDWELVEKALPYIEDTALPDKDVLMQELVKCI